MDLNFSGKTVIVTGGSSGIGRAVCKRFAEHGANVVVCGRNIGRASVAAIACVPTGYMAIAVMMDVT